MPRLTPVAGDGTRERCRRDRGRRGAHLRAHDRRRREVLGRNAAGQLGDNTNTQRLTPVNVTRPHEWRGCHRGGPIAYLRGDELPAPSSAGASTPTGSSATTRSCSDLTPVSVTGLDQRRDRGRRRKRSHVRARERRRQVLGLEHQRPARRRHADRSASRRSTSPASRAASQRSPRARRTPVRGRRRPAVQCWGYNQHGELGDGTLVVQRLAPVDVFGLTSGVTAITAGNQHTCAVTRRRRGELLGRRHRRPARRQRDDAATDARRR